MAKMKRNIGEFVSGKIGNVVFVSNGRKSYVRSIPHRKKDSWTDQQVFYRQRISIVAGLWRMLKTEFIGSIWNKAAENMNGYAWFVKKNIGALSIDGTIFDPSLLFVTDGHLMPLQNLKAEIALESNAIIALSWTNDPHLKPERLDDAIFSICYYNDQFSKVKNTGLTRKRLYGEFYLPIFWEDTPVKDGVMHLYIFAADPDHISFTPGKYFKITLHQDTNHAITT